MDDCTHSCSQWLSVQVENSDEYVFVGNMDSGIKCTLSKFADNTKLSGVLNTLEDAIQRDLSSLERQAHASLMKFSKAKCNVLQLGWNNPKHRYGPGGEWLESSPEEKI